MKISGNYISKREGIVLRWTLLLLISTLPLAGLHADEKAVAKNDAVISDLRDPFWPIGWEPQPEQPNEPVQKPVQPRSAVVNWEGAMAKIKISGISETFEPGVYIAIVKGYGVVEKGEILTIRFDGMAYQVLIKDITSEGVVPERLGVAPLN